MEAHYNTGMIVFISNLKLTLTVEWKITPRTFENWAGCYGKICREVKIKFSTCDTWALLICLTSNGKSAYGVPSVGVCVKRLAPSQVLVVFLLAVFGLLCLDFYNTFVSKLNTVLRYFCIKRPIALQTAHRRRCDNYYAHNCASKI